MKPNTIPARQRPTDPRAHDPLERILDRLARCDDPLVSRWGQALLARGEGAQAEPAAKVGEPGVS